MRIVVFGNEDEIVGFSLAGVDTVQVDKKNFVQKFKEISDSEDIGIVVITDRFFDLFQENFYEKMRKKAVPAVIFIPSFDGIHMKKSLKEFVADVIGIGI